MTISTRFVRRAVAAAVACAAIGLPVHTVHATAPPTTQPPASDDTAAPDPDVAPVDGEIVESWALAPAGSLDPNEAGNRPELSYSSTPGEVIEDAVNLFNYGNVPLTFRVYATDAFNNEEGKFDLLPGDEEPVDVGTWVTFPQEEITLPAGKQVTIPITITVPADAAPGDHAGAVVASNVAISTDAAGQVVNLDRRTGTRLYMRVSGPLAPELAVADVQTTYDHALNPLAGTAHVSFRVENRGNVRLSGTVSVAIAGPFGLGERTVRIPDVAELLPGGQVVINTEIDDVSALVLESTAIRVETAEVADVGAVVSSTGSDLTFAPPISLLILLLLLVIGLLLRRMIRRRATALTSADSDSDGELDPTAARELLHQPS